MDGIEARKQVFLIGATNRPDIVDPAILRPGRLDKILFVGFPAPEDRADILRALTKNGSRPKLAADVSLDEVAADANLEWFTGADLAALVREACVAALKEKLSLKSAEDGKSDVVGRSEVRKEHFQEAARNVRSSVNPADRVRYELLRQTYSSSQK
uniref:Uncharacterized protein n=1 Tax=Plectus sambesii TaxID=2011161 RepID=A0A914W2V8_9BILA